MNGKKAKQLRRMAREVAQAAQLPEGAVYDEKEYLVPNMTKFTKIASQYDAETRATITARDISDVHTTLTLNKDCERALYQRLKDAS